MILYYIKLEWHWEQKNDGFRPISLYWSECLTLFNILFINCSFFICHPKRDRYAQMCVQCSPCHRSQASLADER